MTAIVAPTCARLPAYGSRIELCLSSLPSLFKVLRQGASRRRLFLVWGRKVDHCDRQTLTAIPRLPLQYFRCGVESKRLGRKHTKFVCAFRPFAAGRWAFFMARLHQWFVPQRALTTQLKFSRRQVRRGIG